MVNIKNLFKRRTKEELSLYDEVLLMTAKKIVAAKMNEIKNPFKKLMAKLSLKKEVKTLDEHIKKLIEDATTEFVYQKEQVDNFGIPRLLNLIKNKFNLIIAENARLFKAKNQLELNNHDMHQKIHEMLCKYEPDMMVKNLKKALEQENKCTKTNTKGED